MKKLKVIIVDDEIIMCGALQHELEKYPNIEVLAMYHDGDEALQGIIHHNPDIVFLDIRMPGLNGLEVAAELDKKENPPAVVFVTAYDDCALKSYDVNALDYILKPFDADDIDRVLRKMRRFHIMDTPEPTPKNCLPQNNAEFRPQKYCTYRDDVMEIISSDSIKLFYIEAGEVFALTADDKKFAMKQALQDIEQKADPQHFFRCHRNYIVNVNYIKQISPWFNRGYLLKLGGEKTTEVPVSRSNVKKLEKYIQF